MRRSSPEGGSGPGKRPNGALETEVLGVLWTAAGPLSPGDVQEALGLSGVDGLAYTTVATTLSRLLAKGQVQRQAAGRGHVYFPTRDRAESVAERMRGVLAEFAGPDVDRGPILSRFVAGLDPADGAVLRRLLAESDRPPARKRRGRSR